jgi:hypothetical protein
MNPSEAMDSALLESPKHILVYKTQTSPFLYANSRIWAPISISIQELGSNDHDRKSENDMKWHCAGQSLKFNLLSR